MQVNTKQEDLKNYGTTLNSFTIFNLVVFICFSFYGNFSISNLSSLYDSVTIKDGIIISGAAILTFILNAFLPSRFKESLVFHRLKYPLPGTRIFTELSLKDNRINLDELKRRYGILPIEPSAQNKLWYQVYSKYKYDQMVFTSHRSYLLARDLTGLSFLFFFVYSISTIIIKVFNVI